MIISKTNMATNLNCYSDADSLIYEIETENVYHNFSKNKDMLDFINHSSKLKYYHSNVLVLGKMKDEMGDVAIEEFVGSKTKMYPILVRNSNEYKNTKSVNKNVVAKISHNEGKDVLLNKKRLTFNK